MSARLTLLRVKQNAVSTVKYFGKIRLDFSGIVHEHAGFALDVREDTLYYVQSFLASLGFRYYPSIVHTVVLSIEKTVAYICPFKLFKSRSYKKLD